VNYNLKTVQLINASVAESSHYIYVEVVAVVLNIATNMQSTILTNTAHFVYSTSTPIDVNLVFIVVEPVLVQK
jgi:hypothetical protein